MAPYTRTPLLVIVGPTASGKSGVAMSVAKKYNGEIICADSRTIYKGMDIGTAKPSLQDQRLIKHHLLDVAEPGDIFTAYNFKSQAEAIIKDVRSRGKLPILVGGTGLYIDSIIFNYNFPSRADSALRKKFEGKNLEELYEYCCNNNVILPENVKNKRYVVNAILRKGTDPRRQNIPIKNLIIVGISTTKEQLKQRVMQRTEYIFSHGVVEEAKKLGKIYGWDSEAMTGNIYPLIHKYLLGDIDINQVKQKFIASDMRLAKRQKTWFKRNSYIAWLPLEEIEEYIAQELAKAEQK